MPVGLKMALDFVELAFCSISAIFMIIFKEILCKGERNGPVVVSCLNKTRFERFFL